MNARAITDPLVAPDLAAELAALRGRIDALSERVQRLEQEAPDEERPVQL